MNKKILSEYNLHIKKILNFINTESGFASSYKMVAGLLNDAVNKIKQGIEIEQDLIDLIIDKLNTIEKNCPYSLIKNQKENLIGILKTLGFEREIERLLKL